MALRVIGPDGGKLSHIASAVSYAMNNGAKVLSMSFGTTSNSYTLERALTSASDAGVQLVAAAGNDGKDLELEAYYPCSYRMTLLTCVAATMQGGTRASFSNYGRSIVHVAAPGNYIKSTVLNNRYADYSGTSMACPHVAGILAVLLSVFPHLPTNYLRQLVLENSQAANSLKVMHGRVNLNAAVTAARALWVSIVNMPAGIGGDAGDTQIVGLELGRSGPGWTSGLLEGEFNADLHLQATDGVITDTATVPVTLRVQGIPQLRSELDTIDFGQVPVNASAQSALVIRNVGNGSAAVVASVDGGFE
eukprot:1277980-Amphidinium_carterae.1